MVAGPESTSRQSKGSILLVARRFTERTIGADSWSRVLSGMPDGDRAIAENALAFTWVPSQVIATAYGSLAAELDASGRSTIRDYGRFAAEQDLTVLHRVFLKMASPPYVIEKSMQYWRRFHTWGTWSVQREGRAVVATLAEFHIGAAYCESLVAYLARLMELVGAKDVTVRHGACAGLGASACVFRAHYR